MDKDTLISLTLRKLRRFKHIEAIVLFGSWAKGTQHEGSDVDLAVLWHPQHVPSPLKIWKLRGDLETLLHSDVDLVCLNTCNNITAIEVIDHGDILFRQGLQYDYYRIQAMNDYAELRKSNKEMREKLGDW